MESFTITATKYTPAVKLNLTKGILEIKGRSSPENSLAFYSPIKSVLSEDWDVNDLRVKIDLEYFNTSSSKCLFDIFKSLRSKKANGAKVNIFWCYNPDDEDMLEIGEDYSDLLNLPFVFVESHACA